MSVYSSMNQAVKAATPYERLAVDIFRSKGIYAEKIKYRGTSFDPGDVLLVLPGDEPGVISYTRTVDVKCAREWTGDDHPYSKPMICSGGRFHKDWLYLIFSLDMTQYLSVKPWTLPDSAFTTSIGTNATGGAEQQKVHVPLKHCTLFTVDSDLVDKYRKVK